MSYRVTMTMRMGVDPTSSDYETDYALNLFRFGSDDEIAAFEEQRKSEIAAAYDKSSEEWETSQFSHLFDSESDISDVNPLLCDECSTASLVAITDYSSARTDTDDMYRAKQKKQNDLYLKKLDEKYSVLSGKLQHKHFLINHSNCSSTKKKQTQTSMIYDIMRKFAWHKDIPADLRSTIKGIITDIGRRVKYEILLRIAKCLEKYQHRIGRHKYDIGSIHGIEYSINVPEDAKPVRRNPINLPPEHESEIKDTVELLLKYGIIEPYEGPWASNVFVVYNGDGSTRMVCNYKEVNRITEDDSYPVGSVSDMLEKFQGKTIYSTFDILKAFYNVKVAQTSKKYTAFTTKYGTYVWNVMPFGGKNCPATWVRASDQAFETCKDMIKYIDDIVLASAAEKDLDEMDVHCDAIESFFDCIDKYNLKVKITKCEWFVRSVKFLGNIIDEHGRRPDDAYIRKLLQFRHPTNRTELRAYLGAIEWLSHHVYGLKEITLPFGNLLKKKNAWHWTKAHQDAFIEAQKLIQKAEVLHHPDFNEPFYVFTDASKRTYSGVLLQKRHKKYVIIDMFSRKFNERDTVRHITSKELISVVDSVSLWERFLYLNKFVIHSDSRNLLHLFRQTQLKKTVNKLHWQWANTLSQFSFKVQHIAGIHNKLADYYSRYVNDDQLLDNFREGNIAMSEYNKHKRMKFRHKKKPCGKKKSFYMEIPQCESPNDDNFHKIYYANLIDTQWMTESVRNNAYFRQYKQRTDLVDLKSPYLDYLRWSSDAKRSTFTDIERLYVQRKLRPQRKQRVRYDAQALHDREAFEIPNTLDPVKLKQIRNKKYGIDDAIHNSDNEEILNWDHKDPERSVSVYSATVNSHDIEYKEDLDGMEQRIVNRVHSSSKNTSDRTAGIMPEASHLSMDSSADSNEPLLVNERYHILNRIYCDELLKDPLMGTLERFERSKIIQNQKEHVIYRIIRRHLEGIDTEDEIKTLPKRLRTEITKGYYKFDVDGDILLYIGKSMKTRICLPPQHRWALIRWYHENEMFGGHGAGINSVIAQIQSKWYWPGYENDIREFIRTCAHCQHGKGIPNRNLGLQSQFNAKEINEWVCIDHVGPLPETTDGKYKYVTTYYDRFSGYTKSIPAHDISAATTAVNFVRFWCCIFGAPIHILTDLGSDFRSEFMDYLCKMIKTDHKYTTSYHAQTDGAVERFNRTMKQQLRCIAMDKKQLHFHRGDSWHLFLPYINCIHNNRIGRRTNFKLCPNEIMIGRRLDTPLDFTMEDFPEGLKNKRGGKLMEGWVKNMIRLNKGIADRELAKYHQKRKELADRKKKTPTFKVNDLVLYWNGEYPAKGVDKLDVKWTGPYRILSVFNDGNNYTLNHIRYRGVYLTANVKRIIFFRPRKVHQLRTSHRAVSERIMVDDDLKLDEIDIHSAKNVPTFVERPIEHHNQSDIDEVDLITLDGIDEYMIDWRERRVLSAEDGSDLRLYYLRMKHWLTDNDH